MEWYYCTSNPTLITRVRSSHNYVTHNDEIMLRFSYEVVTFHYNCANALLLAIKFNVEWCRNCRSFAILKIHEWVSRVSIRNLSFRFRMAFSVSKKYFKVMWIIRSNQYTNEQIRKLRTKLNYFLCRISLYGDMFYLFDWMI